MPPTRRGGAKGVQALLGHCCSVVSRSSTASPLVSSSPSLATAAPLSYGINSGSSKHPSLGSTRGIVRKASQPSWAKAATDASLNVLVNAVTRPKGIDDPTLKVADPGRVGLATGEEDDDGDRMEDLALDLTRKPRPELLTKWVEAAGAVDPFKLVANDMRSLSAGIKSLLGSDHPVLEACAKYLFEMDGGKKIRPTMVLLVARATATHEEREGHGGGTGDEHGIVPLPSQKRLAEITEMIHTASLFHDDVIDEADSRRGVPSINKLYGNKMAILAGDFLLARASVSLARLRNVEVVELLSTVIEHLVKGEVMQSRPQALLDGGESGEAALQYYLHKNYYKTGSLMANSCRAAVLLAGHDERLQEQAFAYGRHVGLAFQLVDDVLDFEQSSETLGKPALNDLRQGLATAPVLLAANQFPQEICELVKRKFRSEGDVERALELVQRSNGLRQAKDLALVQTEQAMEAAMSLHPSPARDALIKLASLVISRTH